MGDGGAPKKELVRDWPDGEGGATGVVEKKALVLDNFARDGGGEADGEGTLASSATSASDSLRAGLG